MTLLASLLRAETSRRGAIPFREFMAEALYHPNYGYYASGRAQIGRGGDFITNVSVGPLLGRLHARQFAEMWERLGAPSRWSIVEQGASVGDFAKDALLGLREFAADAFAAVEYTIVEPVEKLRVEQTARLAGLPVRWSASLEDLPPMVGVHFSNELLDAFPIHLVVRTQSGWAERHVQWTDDRFTFTDGPLTDPRLAPHLARIEASPGFITEVNLAALDWLSTLAARLDRGFVLLTDYGYPRDEYCARTAGTLSAYAAHQREPDPLARPGEIDLTAHVEFTSLIEHAGRLGLRTHGFLDQHRYMVGVSRLHFTGEPPSPQEIRAFKTLMHPTLLGQAFKVLCLEKGVPPASSLAGFEFARSGGEVPQ